MTDLAKACDCHIHVFDRRYPMAIGDTRHVPDASVADYLEVRQAWGTQRVVVVQPSTYGTDNACTLAALDELGEAARGVVVVDTSVTDAALAHLHTHRVRGVRFNLARPGATTVDMLQPLADRVAPLGWHVQVHMTPEQVVAHRAILQSLPVAVVVDHMARIPAPHAASHPAFEVVARLAQDGRGWIKLSGPYMFSSDGLPGCDDVAPLAKALAGAVPARLVWGSDWPHPGASKPVRASDVAAWRDRWLPDPALRRRILVDNPALLYGFAPTD